MTDTDFDLDWVREHRPVVDPPSEQVTAQARASLMARAATPFGAHRAGTSRRKLVIRASTATALAAAAAAAVVAAGPGLSGSSHSPAQTAGGAPATGADAGQPALIRLAAQVLAEPTAPGDATLVLRSQVTNGGAPVTGADLYADNGQYFYAPTESGLPAQVAAGHNQGGDLFAREVAAAEQAASSTDLSSAALAMEVAPDPAAAAGLTAGSLLADDWLWENSLDALVAGAGNATVRAGVIRLVSTLPEVTVTDTTAHGQPAIQLTATFPNTSKCASNGANPGATDASLEQACAKPAGGGFEEQWTINATTGIPISFSGGAPGQASVSQITYQVSRVTLSQVADGQVVALPATSTSTPGA